MNEHQGPTGQTLRIFLWTMALLCVPVTLAFAYISPGKAPIYLVHLGYLELLCIGLLVVTLRGRVQMAAGLLISFLWAYFFIIAIFAGGIRAQTFTGMLVLIVMAGTCLGGRSATAIALLNGLAGLLLVYLERSGSLPARTIAHSSFDIWLILSFISCLLVVLMRLGSADIRRALEMARNELADRQRAESALRRSEERLRLALEAVQMGTWEWNVETNEVNGSELVEGIFGLEKGTFARTYEAYVSLIHSEDRPVALWTIEAALQGVSSVYQIEHRIVWPDGSVRRIECKGRVYRDEALRPIRMAGIVMDITERKRAQEELGWKTAFLEAQVNSSPDGILVVDQRGKKILQNERMNELWKFPPEIITDQDDAKQFQYEIGQTKDPEAFAAKVRRLYAHPGEISQDEIELNDGTVLDRYSSPVWGRDGQYYGRIWNFRDITEKKQLAAQFLRSQRMESIGSLAGGIAHDLNNALAPILMASEMLRTSCTDPETIRMLDVISDSAERGRDMVRQVLTFARGNESERGLVQVEPLINEMVGIARHTFPKTILIRTNITSDVWSVSGNRTQLHQVLLNLCVNARDAMARGGTLTLSVSNVHLSGSDVQMSPRKKPGPFLVLSVTDTGSGMSADVRARIFDPFFSTKAPNKGTGLGLSTVHTIVKEHGGFITVNSEVGKGTEFKVYLPAQESFSVSAAGGALPSAPMGNGELILVVDDETAIRNIATETLHMYGYRVVTAGDGSQAIAVATQHLAELRLVIADLAMPIMDGLAMIRTVRTLSPQFRFIAASGSDSEKMSAALEELGVKALLRKPYSADELLRTVHDVLHEAS